MSKKDNDYNSENQEPWEQLYDTEYDDSASRSQQRKQKRGIHSFDDRFSFAFLDRGNSGWCRYLGIEP